MNIKKLIGFFAIFILLLTFASTSYADRDGNRQHNQDRDRDENHSNKWKLSGTCEITYTVYGNGYVHTYTLASANNGTLSGTGFYDADPSYTEAVSGNVTGNNIAFHVLYTGTASGYYVDATGVISSTGVLSGSAIDSLSQPSTFVSTGSCAKKANDDGHDQNLRLDWKRELTPAKCNATGNPIINVEEKVKNDVDSGMVANWAIDNYVRHIKVWQVSNTDDQTSSFCALVSYEGKFNAVKGQTGPGGTGVIGKDVDGEMEGGYRATFTGALLSSPLWPTHGSAGTVNYGCNITGTTCIYVSWTEKYFGSSVGSFDQPWWGWIYKAEHHGTWINAISGSLGNIL